MTVPKYRQVALLIDTATDWGRRMIRGIGRYAQQRWWWVVYATTRSCNEATCVLKYVSRYTHQVTNFQHFRARPPLCSDSVNIILKRGREPVLHSMLLIAR